MAIPTGAGMVRQQATKKIKTKLLKKYLLLLILAVSFSSYSADSTASGQYNFVKMDYLGLNDEYETPYFVFQGEKLGPVMILDGGIHGDEIASYMACDSIVKYLKLF